MEMLAVRVDEDFWSREEVYWFLLRSTDDEDNPISKEEAASFAGWSE